MTILFKDDWDKYPRACLHLETKNESFIRLAALYRDMHIDNHNFILALHNPDLKHIDPFNPNITTEEMVLVAIECKQNFWYYIREIARGLGGTYQNPVRFKANRGNISAFWLFMNHIFFTLIQPRQTGKSFSTDNLMTWLLNIRCRYTNINLLTKDDKLRSANLERLKDLDTELPFYLRQRTNKDIANTEELHISSLNNKYSGLLPNRSPKLALNVGRGLTSAIFQVDESAYLPNIEIIIPAALAAGTAARDIARNNNEPFGTIFTTTAGKKDDRDGKYTYRLLQNSADWTEKFFDCKSLEDLEYTIRRASVKGELRVNCTFNHRQLGYTDAWLKRAMEEANSTGEDAERDFLNKWTAGTILSPIPINIAELIRNSEKPVSHFEIYRPYSYTFRFYIPEHEIRSYFATRDSILSVDSSDAIGNDDIGLTIRDVKTGSLIAAANVNETNIITFCEWLVYLIETCPKLTTIIERRSTGSTILDYLLLMLPAKNIDPFKRLYNKVVQNPEEYPNIIAEVNKPIFARNSAIYVTAKKYFGFATSGSGVTSRTDLYSSTLSAATKMTGDLVFDKKLIDQILGLVVINGRVDHEAGEHDDLCFVAETLVRTIDGNRPIKDLKVGDLVLTRCGYKPIIKLFKSEKEVITKFGLTGTPNHPFITSNGLIEFKDLKLETKVITWNEKQSITMEKTIIDILTQKEVNTETISTHILSSKNHLWLYIDKFIKITSERFRKVAKYIIKMETISIIQKKILNVLQLKNIEKDTHILTKLENYFQIMQGKKILSESGEKITQNLLNNKQLNTEKKVQGLVIGEKITQNLLERFILKQEPRAKNQEIKKQTVYNIMVLDCHEYFVNDILVHNCISWLLSYWLLTKGRNLHYYGINSRDIFCMNTTVNKENNETNSYESQHQRQIRANIEDIVNKLQSETNEYLINIYERNLRSLAERLSNEDKNILSVDELINNISRNKRLSRPRY